MLCILCLSNSDRVMEIFGKKGLELNVCCLIVKHFWLQPSEEDENAHVICHACWNALDSFHKFYERVESAHFNLLVGNNAKEEERESIEQCNDSLTSEIGEELETEPTEDCLLDPLSHTEHEADSLEKLDNTKDIDSESVIQIKPRQRTVFNESATDSEETHLMTRRELSQEYEKVIRDHMELCCDICQQALENFHILTKHFITAHNERGYAVCCGRKFHQRNALVDHIYLHHNREHF